MREIACHGLPGGVTGLAGSRRLWPTLVGRNDKGLRQGADRASAARAAALEICPLLAGHRLTAQDCGPPFPSWASACSM